MKDFFLVIDTETSGLPKKWDVAYDIENNWPHILQVAWVVFDKNGKEIKSANYYLKNNGFKINKYAFNIHKITTEFLDLNGEDRKKILTKLAYDLQKYQPLIIGHFVELDLHMMNVEFHRFKIENSLNELPHFCTMKASVPYIKNPSFKYLKLNRFYKTLFHKRPVKLHDALADAKLTAEIFFHLLEKGEVSDAIIKKQTELNQKEKKIPLWIFSILALLIISLLIWLCYE
ncbi:MAG: 3'-5' exonuclease [Pelobium sp.]